MTAWLFLVTAVLCKSRLCPVSIKARTEKKPWIIVLVAKKVSFMH